MKDQKRGLALLGLVFITFLAAIQYVFLRNVPDSVSTFSFMCVTNVLGLLILGAVRFKKLISIRGRTVAKGALFALELTGFNFFLLLGARYLVIHPIFRNAWPGITGRLSPPGGCSGTAYRRPWLRRRRRKPADGFRKTTGRIETVEKRFRYPRHRVRRRRRIDR